MTVLGIETATTVCAVALVSDGKILGEASVNEKYVHAERLMRQVDAVLREGHCSLGQLDGIAISIGPGSFTGLRIGLSVAKGLAYAVDKGLIPVPTLLALAQRVVDAGIAGKDEYVLSILDARRDEVYCQLFRSMDGELGPVMEPRDLPVSSLPELVVKGRTWVTGDAFVKLRTVPCVTSAPWEFVPDDIAVCSAGSVGLVGESLIKKGKKGIASNLEPLYMKDFFVKQPS